jgi:CRP-like cAMP-binding protein
MPIEFHQLSRLISSRELTGQDTALIARAFTERTLRRGEVLWQQGMAAPDLGVLHKGKLVVQVDGEEIGSILPGDVLGETSALWANATRSASLVATEPSTVLLLPTLQMHRLAQAFPVFHERLLDRCLEAQSKRIRATDVRIAKLSQGVLPAPDTSAPGGLARIWKLLKSVVGDASRPALLPMLRDQPGLGSQSEPVLEAIAEAFEPYAFDQGELLAREGEPGDAVFLLAVGEVQALRHVRNRMAEVLVSFQPGWLFGAVTLAVPGPRTATCMAATPGWVYRMDRQAYEQLGERARLAWKECLVATLGVQLRNANALLAGFQSGGHPGGPLPEPELQQLLQAAGALLGAPGDAGPGL